MNLVGHWTRTKLQISLLILAKSDIMYGTYDVDGTTPTITGFVNHNQTDYQITIFKHMSKWALLGRIRNATRFARASVQNPYFYLKTNTRGNKHGKTKS